MRRTGRLSTPRAMRLRRSLAARLFIAFCFVALLGAAGRLQVLQVDYYAKEARNQRLRPVMVPAPRGTIYDRYGQVIAENVVGYRVLIMPAPWDVMQAQIDKLRPILNLTDEEITRAKRRWSRETHLPMTLTVNADPIAVATLEEHREDFPGVLIVDYAKRHYPAGEAVAHMIGYVAEITEGEIASREWAGYEQGQWIGKAGLERQYEKEIGGVPGSRYLEIDARGRIMRWLPEELGTVPIPGHDLQLHLDLDLQRYVMEIWPRQFRGAFVALDPKTGGVLAYYSHPSFDPNKFIGGIPKPLWDSLQADSAKPLLDRVSSGGAGQPPASAWKLPVAAMALEEAVIKPKEFMPWACGGGIYMLGRYARCWDKKGHGRSDLVKGIMQSCDIYFYQVGARLGLKRYLDVGTRMGFQKRTGIDLPYEARNQMPENTDWWVQRLGYKPKASEMISLAIGQGPQTMTPLKLAHMYAALVRPDGKAPAPRLAVTDSLGPITIDFNLSPEHHEWLMKGMRRVMAQGGTAPLSRLPPTWDFIGKTGTAQACAGCPLRDHAWFVGAIAVPGYDMEIVAAMFLQHAEHGYTASGYVANALNFYMNRKYGRPFDRFPTPRDRFPRGMPVGAWFTQPVVDPPRR